MTARELALATNVRTLLFRRWGGAVIDFIVLAGAALCVDQMLPDEAPQWKLIADALLGSSYFVGMEMALGGTVGKLITGLRIVDASGHRPNLEAAVARTLLRLIEVNPIVLGAIPAALCVVFSKTKQRLGDMAAGTFVLLHRDLAACGLGLSGAMPAGARQGGEDR